MGSVTSPVVGFGHLDTAASMCYVTVSASDLGNAIAIGGGTMKYYFENFNTVRLMIVVAIVVIILFLI